MRRPSVDALSSACCEAAFFSCCAIFSSNSGPIDRSSDALLQLSSAPFVPSSIFREEAKLLPQTKRNHDPAKNLLQSGYHNMIQHSPKNPGRELRRIFPSIGDTPFPRLYKELYRPPAPFQGPFGQNSARLPIYKQPFLPFPPKKRTSEKEPPRKRDRLCTGMGRATSPRRWNRQAPTLPVKRSLPPLPRPTRMQ